MENDSIYHVACQQLLSELLLLGTVIEEEEDNNNQNNAKNNKTKYKFIKGNECLYSLREILKILIIDNEKHKLYIFFNSINGIQKYLIPLLISNWDNPEIVFQVLRLLVLLTMSTSSNVHDYKLQLETLQIIGRNIIDNTELLIILMEYLEQPFHFDADKRTPRANQLLELLLTFFKNLLEIPNGEPNNTTLAFLYDLHDDILLRFGEEHIIETISLLCAFISAEKSSSLNFLLLEIMALLFKLEEPEKLIAPSSGANSATALRLQAALNEKKASVPVRHSKFGGTFIVPRMGGQTQIASYIGISNNTLPNENVNGKSGRAKVALTNQVLKRSENEKVKALINETAASFLNKGFRELMSAIFKEFELGNPQLCGTDKLNYMFIASFFLEYHRLTEIQKNKSTSSKFDASTVFLTINDKSFNWLIRHMKIFFGEDKKKSMWNAVHAGVKMYRNMIITLYEMMNNGDEDNKQTAELLLRNLFYERETFDVFVNMLKYYEPSFATQEYLSYAVEAVHYTLHILKHFGTKNTLIMRDKARKVRKTNTTHVDDNNDEVELDSSKVGENADPLNTSVNSETTNGASATETCESKTEGEEKATESYNDTTTDQGEDVEGEVRDMIATEEARYNQKEMELNFNTLLGQFMNNNVIRCYFFLLKNYSKNSSALNHMIIRFLERILSEMKLGAFLFHVPYLLIINKILADPVSYDSKYNKLVDFCKKTVAMFFEAAAQNPMIYILALFTHSKGKVEEITNPGEKSRQKEEKQRAQEERKTAALQKRIRNTVDRSANLSLANQLYDEPEPEDGVEKNPEDPNIEHSSSESEEPDVDMDTLNAINKTILSNAKPKAAPKKVRKAKAASSGSEDEAGSGSESEAAGSDNDSQSEESDIEDKKNEREKKREEKKLKKERRAAKKAAKLEKRKLRKLEKKRLRLERQSQENENLELENEAEITAENESDAENGVNKNVEESNNANDSMDVDTVDYEATENSKKERRSKKKSKKNKKRKSTTDNEFPMETQLTQHDDSVLPIVEHEQSDRFNRANSLFSRTGSEGRPNDLVAPKKLKKLSKVSRVEPVIMDSYDTQLSQKVTGFSDDEVELEITDD